MLSRSVILQNPDGSHRQLVTAAEARRMEANGHALRISRVKAAKMIYRLRSFASPSNSPESPACLTRADMNALAGLQKLTTVRRERLEGWGLITSVQVKIVEESAKPYRGEVRALYNLVDEVEQMEQDMLAQEALPQGSSFLPQSA